MLADHWPVLFIGGVLLGAAHMLLNYLIWRDKFMPHVIAQNVGFCLTTIVLYSIGKIETHNLIAFICFSAGSLGTMFEHNLKYVSKNDNCAP